MIANSKKVTETKSATKETLLTPRFYTTNFQEIAELDISENKEEIEAVVEEFELIITVIILYEIKNFRKVGILLMKKLKRFL